YPVELVYTQAGTQDAAVIKKESVELLISFTILFAAIENCGHPQKTITPANPSLFKRNLTVI
ncbi:hypothetical protein H5410_054538, partial [Solanum commersonii]